MGFFDRRDKRRRRGQDDFGSPVEEIDLSAPPPAPEPSVDDDEPAGDPEFDPPTDQIDITSPELAATASLARYGVDQAIELMQSLPQDNLELAVRIVKQTLESTNIQIPPIIEEANQRLEHCKNRGETLKSELAHLEQEIRWRREELARMERDVVNISMVRERLIMAEKLSLTGKQPVLQPTDDADTSAQPARQVSGGQSGRRPSRRLPSVNANVKRSNPGLPRPTMPPTHNRRPETYEPSEDEYEAVTEVSAVPDGHHVLEEELKKPAGENPTPSGQRAAKPADSRPGETAQPPKKIGAAQAKAANSAGEASASDEGAVVGDGPDSSDGAAASTGIAGGQASAAKQPRNRKTSVPPPVPKQAKSVNKAKAANDARAKAASAGKGKTSAKAKAKSRAANDAQAKAPSAGKGKANARAADDDQTEAASEANAAPRDDAEDSNAPAAKDGE